MRALNPAIVEQCPLEHAVRAIHEKFAEAIKHDNKAHAARIDAGKMLVRLRSASRLARTEILSGEISTPKTLSDPAKMRRNSCRWRSQRTRSRT